MSGHTTKLAPTAGRETPRGERSRRSFLIRSGATMAIALGVLLAMSRGAHAEKPDPRKFSLPNLYPGQNLSNFLEILQDEEDHIVQLTKLADNPRPMPTFRNLVAKTPI